MYYSLVIRHTSFRSPFCFSRIFIHFFGFVFCLSWVFAASGVHASLISVFSVFHSQFTVLELLNESQAAKTQDLAYACPLAGSCRCSLPVFCMSCACLFCVSFRFQFLVRSLYLSIFILLVCLHINTHIHIYIYIVHVTFLSKLCHTQPLRQQATCCGLQSDGLGLALVGLQLVARSCSSFMCAKALSFVSSRNYFSPVQEINFLVICFCCSYLSKRSRGPLQLALKFKSFASWLDVFCDLMLLFICGTFKD